MKNKEIEHLQEVLKNHAIANLNENYYYLAIDLIKIIEKLNEWKKEEK